MQGLMQKMRRVASRSIVGGGGGAGEGGLSHGGSRENAPPRSPSRKLARRASSGDAASGGSGDASPSSRAAVHGVIAGLDAFGMGASTPDRGGAGPRRVLYTGPHTTAFAMWTPILKDFARRVSAPIPRFQSPPSTPFNAN
jgi:hypothetical protein